MVGTAREVLRVAPAAAKGGVFRCTCKCCNSARARSNIVVRTQKDGLRESPPVSGVVDRDGGGDCGGDGATVVGQVISDKTVFCVVVSPLHNHRHPCRSRDRFDLTSKERDAAVRPSGTHLRGGGNAAGMRSIHAPFCILKPQNSFRRC